ncbi:hypothetical protein KC678_03675 [Candidatus Dojkabacteria bacterium]|uniref:Uncharacterized protein n=1 Tax=Candidatus Dojkabacteria bacterium TaxID=2099670 RepID=A0A955L1V5_9BACT|nr:hypothetical protein [Candidatus Dojkabacteria bacterium]
MNNRKLPLDILIIAGLIVVSVIAYFVLSFQQQFITIDADTRGVLGASTEKEDKPTYPIKDVTPDVYLNNL